MSKTQEHYFITDIPIDTPILALSDPNNALTTMKSAESKKMPKNLKPMGLHTKYEGMTFTDEKLGFTSKTDRFYHPMVQTFFNPGPGSYNLGNNTFKNKKISFNSKGYGNGFLSQTKRFDSYADYIKQFAPGPSDYSSETFYNCNSLIANPLRGRKYVEDDKKNQLIKMKNSNIKSSPSNETLSITGANTSKATDITNNELKQLYYEYSKEDDIFEEPRPSGSFVSKTVRFPVLVNDNPGPGTYNIYDKNGSPKNSKDNQLNGTKGFSFFFRNHHPNKKSNLLQKFNIKTDCDLKYKIKSGTGNGNRVFITKSPKKKVFKKNMNIKIEGSSNSKNKGENVKKVYKRKNNQVYIPYDYRKFKTLTNANIIESYAIVPEENDLKAKHQSDKFFGSPRWRENPNEFKVPGPAYYSPRMKHNFVSFNRNNNEFIISQGGSYNMKI